VTELKFLSDPTAGELRIGSSDAVAAGMLGAIIDRLSRQHPRLTFEVTLGGGLTDLQYRELQARNLDLVIGRLPNAMPDDVEAETLYHDPTFVVAGMQNAWARRRKIDLAEMIDEPWCLPSLESYPWSRIAEAFRARGLSLPRQTVTARSIQFQISLVETGRFLSIIPRTVLHFRRSSPQLKILPVDVGIQPYPVGIATLRNRTLSPVAQLFSRCARDVARPFAVAK
jgi:DNA-binding transcriptional LysR family regulator